LGLSPLSLLRLLPLLLLVLDTLSGRT